MAPVSTDHGDPPEPWNTIYIADILEAVDPFTCIRCLHRKDRPGVNTICTSCQLFLIAEPNIAECFVFFTCLKVFDFYLWARQRILSDEFVVKQDSDGTFIEHHIGIPGDKQYLPNVRAIQRPGGQECDDGKIKLCSMTQELLEQVLLTSRQCDNVLVLLANVMKRELLQANSPVLKIDEILFYANHEYTSTHWCYRVTLHNGRQFAVAFADRQLGWLHIVREWEEYVRERFHEWEERDALFYMENPDERDVEEVAEEKMETLSCWEERGVSVRGVGGVLAAHRSQWYPQAHWDSGDVEEWQSQLPPYDMIIEDKPHGWRPERDLTDEEKEIRQKKFGCWLEAKNGGVQALWRMWRKEAASRGKNAKVTGQQKHAGEDAGGKSWSMQHEE